MNFFLFNFQILQLSEFKIFFNYKHENRRALFYLITPTLLFVALECIEITIHGPGWGEIPRTLQWGGIKFLRCIVCISNSMSYAILIGSLNTRFAALNTLLRCILMSSSKGVSAYPGFQILGFSWGQAKYWAKIENFFHSNRTWWLKKGSQV